MVKLAAPTVCGVQPAGAVPRYSTLAEVYVAQGLAGYALISDLFPPASIRPAVLSDSDDARSDSQFVADPRVHYHGGSAKV